jgi:large subunit ribosomal protein L23
MKELHTIIKRPVLTEKSNLLKEGANTIIFEVINDANKNEIKSAVEKLFKVHVLSVNTQIVRGKLKKRGRAKLEAKMPNWKKAIVRIKEGEKIEFFEGV